jgi:hypothetical protein
MKRVFWIASCVLLLVACDEPKPTGGAPTAGNTAQAPKAMTDAELDAADIPVVEDYEEEAAKEIDADNLDAEVAKLEEAITAE